MEPKDYATVIQEVCRLQNIPSDNNIIRNVTVFCKSLDHAKLELERPVREERLKFMATTYIQSILPSLNEFDYTDFVSSELRDDVKDASDRGAEFTPLTSWIGSRMPVLSSCSMNVYIDSRRRGFTNHLDGQGVTDFSFALVPRHTQFMIDDGSVMCHSMPTNVTYFKLGKITLPYGRTLRATNSMNEITLTFTALRSNGAIAFDDTYHFTFTYVVSSVSDDIVELMPSNEFCKFDPPIQTVDDLSIRFNDPIYPITFLPDRMRADSISYTALDGQISFSSPHLATDGEVVVIDTLTSLDDSKNLEVLSDVNNPRGHRITVIDATTIAIGVDLSLITIPDLLSAPWVQFFNRTFRFQMEIGYQSS